MLAAASYFERGHACASSFCKRTDPSRALIVCRNDKIPLCCCCYRIHCRSSLTRTLAAASYHKRLIGRGSRLLLHSFEHDGYLNFNNQTKVAYLSSVSFYFALPISLLRSILSITPLIDRSFSLNLLLFLYE